MAVLYEDRRMETIDVHTHTFPAKIAGKALGKLQGLCGITPCTDGTTEDFLSKMEEFHLDRAVVLNIATAPAQQHTINNCAAGTNRLYGDRLISFGSVHPLGEDPVGELERMVSLGIRGVKLHPDYQGFMVDDPVMDSIYEACSALELPIVFHTGWDCCSPELIHAPPHRTANVLRRFPRLKVVAAHMGGLRQWEEVEEFLVGKEIWLDTAICATYMKDRALMERLVRRHGAGRILLGSDCPWENPAVSIQFVLSLDIPAGEKEKILAGNVKELLNL